MAEAATSAPTSMSFIEFESILHTSEKLVQCLATVHSLNDREYMITEKADGKNFSYWYKQGEPVKYARRTGFLEPNEKLSDYQADIAHYDENIKNLHGILRERARIVQSLISTNSLWRIYWFECDR